MLGDDEILEKPDIMCRENDDIFLDIIGVNIDKGAARLCFGITEEDDLRIKKFFGFRNEPADGF